MSSTQHPLIQFLKTLDGVVIPESPTATDQAQFQVKDDTLDGFEEVNLLEGLLGGMNTQFSHHLYYLRTIGTTFSNAAPDINLPSTRLGTVSRRKLFSLPPAHLPSPSPSPSPVSTACKAQSILRKSFRKTLETVSGFRVRMRTVFVPCVVLDTSQEDRDKIGGEERTVVLCVEIENSGESGQDIGFEVENVEVVISGGEAKATLITWGQESFTSQENVFPLQITQWAQYNLLYAVTFLRSPEELDAFSFARKTTSTTQAGLQRAVSINIHGRPYVKSPSSTTVIYPTSTFPSKWNCVLDLSTNQPQSFHDLDPSDPSTAYPSVLPEPPSPFPTFGLQSSKRSPGSNGPFSTRTTSNYGIAQGGQIKVSTPRMLATPMNANSQKMSLSAQVIPSVYARSPTTYGAPPPPSPHQSDPHKHLSQPLSHTHTPPMFNNSPITPAYPAFPSKSTVLPMPILHAPVVSQIIGGMIGPTLEARRGRESGEPLTPVPHQHHLDAGNGHLGNEQKSAMGVMYEDIRDTIVISIGLLDVNKSGGIGRRKASSSKDKDKEISRGNNNDKDEGKEEVEVDGNSRQRHNRQDLGPDNIYPLDSFTLDIFVFNKSERTRRFEINCSEYRRKRKGADTVGADTGLDGGVIGTANKMGYPGVVPMEGQVRIG